MTGARHDPLPPTAWQAATRFGSGEVPESLRPLGQGNVHDTFLVTLEGLPPRRFVLQRLNPRVFPRPQVLAANLRVVTAHLRRPGPGAGRADLVLPQPLATREGEDLWRDPEGFWWRALTYLEGTRAPLVLEGRSHAQEVGWALGRFHALLRDLSPALLADPLPGFHITPAYVTHFDEVAGRALCPSTPEVRYLLKAIAARRGLAGVLEAAKARGELPLRIMHGDPKVDNVLLEERSGRAVGLVDLDTVGPGLWHYDLGDCLRSAANPLGEETREWERVRFDPEAAAAILRGYREGARNLWTPRERAYLYPAIRLLPFELGLRFFTDYLAGNVYFKVTDPEQNLRRALVQFRLLESLEAQEREIRTLIREGF